MRSVRDGFLVYPVPVRADACDEDSSRFARKISRWAMSLVLLIVLLGIAWNPLVALASNPDADVPSVNVFAGVPAGLFSHAAPAGSSCGLDLVNNTAAQDAAIDHLGSASFDGWVADLVTGKVPSTLWLVLDGAQDFSVRAHTGVDRPDVAAALHNPVFAHSGFHVLAYLTGVPVGDYQVTIYYRVEGKEMVCPTHVTVSVQ